jgi:polysaccharide export outer membrane protein
VKVKGSCFSGNFNAMRRIRTVATVLLLFLLSIYLFGCGDKFWDPTQVGRFRPVPAVNVILDSLGVAEETPSAWEGAEEPRPIDVTAFETDYVFGSGDIVRISIFELLQEGIAVTNDYVVTETGKVSIPEVGVVDALGLTESQLEGEIKQILAPGILKEPSVTVTLLSSQQRTFSILGNGVPTPGRYGIPRYDFRLTDALATAGGVSEFNVSYIYVSRSLTGKEPISGPAEHEVTEPGETGGLNHEMLEIVAPRAQRQQYGSGVVVTSAEMITDKELAEEALPHGSEPLDDAQQAGTEGRHILTTPAEPVGRETIAEPINHVENGRIEWIFQGGKWLPVQVGGVKPAEPGPQIESVAEKAAEPLRERLPQNFDWTQIGTGGEQTRVIEIPVDKLLGGDPRYNVVVRPGDSIHVPVDIIGEFCIMGNVNSQGYINITGRPMTLKMAIAAAGGMGPLAWPKKCEVVRRIGKKKEEIVMVDLEKIARGEQPDFFIKPNDLINVGTHPTSMWRAVLRNAFRATYGFGFIYDRNFADRDFGTSRPIPNWF